MLTCSKCRKSKPSDAFHRDRNRKTGHYPYCKECVKVWAKGYKDRHRDAVRQAGVDRNKKLRDAVLEAYGHACACCNETRREFLAVDHVRNNGAAERRRGVAGAILHLKLIKAGFPSDYRLLCHNCNMARGIYGYCPHEKESK